MKNKLGDLNDHLFAQIERLGNEDISAEDLEKEVTRAEAIIKVSEQIISNANLSLRGAALVAEYGGNYKELMPMLENKSLSAVENNSLSTGIPAKGRRTA